MKQSVYIQKGAVIDIVLDSAVEVGDVVVLGDMVGVANVTGEEGEIISLSIEGVWEMKAKTDDAIAIGDKLYWDDAEKELTVTDTDNAFVGLAITSKEAVAGMVQVKF